MHIRRGASHKRGQSIEEFNVRGSTFNVLIFQIKWGQRKDIVGAYRDAP